MGYSDLDKLPSNTGSAFPPTVYDLPGDLNGTTYSILLFTSKTTGIAIRFQLTSTAYASTSTSSLHIMSTSEEDLSGILTPRNGRRRLRDDVLQLGPRKKAYILIPFLPPSRLDNFPGASPIPSSTPAVTLAEQFTPCALSTR